MYPSYLCCHCGKLEGRVSLRVRLPVLPGRIMIPGPIMMALRVESQTPPPSARRATEYPPRRRRPPPRHQQDVSNLRPQGGSTNPFLSFSLIRPVAMIFSNTFLKLKLKL